MKMFIKTPIAIVLFLTLLPLSAYSKVLTKHIPYSVQSKKHVGLLAWNSQSKGKAPGILLLPEWWGLNNDIKSKARKLAQKGYVVFAADLYGNRKHTDDPKVASKWLDTIIGPQQKLSRKSFMKAYFTLKNEKKVDTNKIAIIGYGYGGSLATDMARRGIYANGVINFFGPVAHQAIAKPGTIKPEILWIKGEDDSWIPKKMEKDFENEMKALFVKFKIISYPEIHHSFTNPQASKIGKKHRFFIAYSKKATQKSWKEVYRFLKRVFK